MSWEPLAIPASVRTETFRQRFYKHVQKAATCWLWTGAHRVDASGYGHIKVEDHWVAAHRVAYFMEIGDIPEGVLVLHRCDNKQCVRPGHLFLGTKSTNAIDAYAKGLIHSNSKKRFCKNGHPYDEANTRISFRSDGQGRQLIRRNCRACDRARSVGKPRRSRKT